VLKPTTDLTAVSLFAGVGGFDLALERQGVKVVAAVEIDKNARGVLAHRFPNSTLFPDVTEVTGEQLISAGFVPERGILTGGFPCQDLSVAGKRAGLAGKRSGLFWEIARLIDELTPQYFILENVPGLLSSNRGQDFGAVLGALVERGYGVTYRVLDAQYFGVPQRRRRVFIVGSFGDTGATTSEILALSEGLSGYLEQSIKKEQETSTTPKRRTRSGGAEGSVTSPQTLAFDTQFGSNANVFEDISPTLKASQAAPSFTEVGMEPIFFDSATHGDGARIAEKTIPTLTSRMGTGGNNTPLVAYADPIIGIDQELNARENIIGSLVAGANSGTQIQAVAYSVREDAQSNTFSATELSAVNALQAHQPSPQSHHAQTFIVEVEPTIFPIQDGREMNHQQNGIGVGSENDPAYTLLATGGQSIATVSPAITSTVRRLTPKECERLQGFPTVENIGIIEWCSDPLKNYVDAENQNPKSPSPALSVANEQPSETAKSAENISPTNAHQTAEPALVNVEVNCEGEMLEIHSQGKLILSVNTAEKSSRSAHPLLNADFVPRLVLTLQTLGLITLNGKVASPTSETSLTTVKSGVPFVRLSGNEMTLLAKDVVSDLTIQHPPTTPTTLFLSDTNHLEQNLQTLCCSVIPAIIGFTQTPTNGVTTYRFHLRAKQPWTEFRIDEKKGLISQADAPRYKQMGNAVAVPCVEWIVKRLVEIDRATR